MSLCAGQSRISITLYTSRKLRRCPALLLGLARIIRILVRKISIQSLNQYSELRCLFVFTYVTLPERGRQTISDTKQRSERGGGRKYILFPFTSLHAAFFKESSPIRIAFNFKLYLLKYFRYGNYGAKGGEVCLTRAERLPADQKL